MAQIFYNGIQLPYADITEFRQEPVYDDVGRTDWYCTKFEVTAQVVINASYLAMLAPALIGIVAPVEPAGIMNVIRTKLMHPRALLSVKFNGIEQIPTPNDEVGTVDSRNGPMPQYCNYIRLTNVTWLLMYKVIAHYWERRNVDVVLVANPNKSALCNNVLYNRWTETVDIDSTQFTKRVRNGKYIIRSDNFSGEEADAARSQMVPVQPLAGCLRVSSSYTITADGLGIQYAVTDQEVYKLPPPLAFEAEGYYTEHTPRGGPTTHGECYVKLRGSKATNEGDLIRTAISVALSKMSVQNANLFPKPAEPLKPFVILEGAMVKVDLYRNEVECRVRGQLRQGKGRTQGLASMSWNTFPYTPGSQPGTTPTYALRGTLNGGGFLLRAAAYWDPSLKAAKLQPNQLLGPGLLQPGQAGRNAEAL